MRTNCPGNDRNYKCALYLFARKHKNEQNMLSMIIASGTMDADSDAIIVFCVHATKIIEITKFDGMPAKIPPNFVPLLSLKRVITVIHIPATRNERNTLKKKV